MFSPDFLSYATVALRHRDGGVAFQALMSPYLRRRSSMTGRSSRQPEFGATFAPDDPAGSEN